jgi:hypothetical protein
MRNFASGAVIAMSALWLAGCGGSTLSGSSTGTGTGGGNNGGSNTNPTYSMGNGSGSTFQSGMVGIANATVAAGGTDSLQVSIVDASGTLYIVGPVTVTFSSSCISQGLATIAASGTSTNGNTTGTISTTTGTAFATYTAKGCSGADVITASATVGSQALTATGTLTAQAGTIGSVQFVSATPATIGLKGTGVAENSTVVFLVVDSAGAPRPGAQVTFSLPTNVGGVTFAPATATSGTDGKVQTVVSAGTQHASIRVTASIADPVLSTQSSVLTVTTGLPASDTFSISVGPADYGPVTLVTSPPPACPNVEAANINQVRVPVTVSLADRYANPAPDGTAVAFTTNAGKVVGSCNTPAVTKGDGECTVQWSSEDPRPSTSAAPPALVNNRGWILATAIGEESFTDANGNGFYEQGEVFKNLGEPYRDDNENATYAQGEYFLDFNNNQMRDGPDGVFKGITCTGVDANATCHTTPWAIGTSHIIIMSTSAAQISLAGVGGNATPDAVTGGFDVPATKTFTVAINIQDLSGTFNNTTHLYQNGNPIPAGSSIAVVGGGITLNGGALSFIEGCSQTVNGDTYVYSGTAGAAGSGSITVTVISEATKTVSSVTIPVTIT